MWTRVSRVTSPRTTVAAAVLALGVPVLVAALVMVGTPVAAEPVPEPAPPSAPIDPTIIDTTDESSRASVTVRLPNELAGTTTLSVAVPTTGTSLTVPLETAQPAESIAVISPPAIHGAPRVGRELTAAEAQFAVENPSLYYQWTRNGEPIAGAIDVIYEVQPIDAGSEIAVVVTATAPGYADAVSTSRSKSIRRLDSQTSASPDRLVLPTSDAVVFTVRVTGDNDVVPVGDVAIYNGGWQIASATLTESDAGSVAVTLPTLRWGVHVITARFAGDDHLGASTSWPAGVVMY